MDNLIRLDAYPVKNVLSFLLLDKTTGNNILFATNAYKSFSITETTQITVSSLEKIANLIQPRVLKSKEEKAHRTKNKAEVFTPAWICNQMNNHCDEEWFHRKNVFNTEYSSSWVTNVDPIVFENTGDWKKYVSSKRLEITCGEAPYLVSRYDASTGKIIPVKDRIGMLDRKLRIVSENTNSLKQWKHWAYIAYRSVYGYEFQGDNLLIARINLLVTFVDYMVEKFKRRPTEKELKFLSNIIVWNLWQMDGLTGAVPIYKSLRELTVEKVLEYLQMPTNSESTQVDCRLYDWENKKEITYNSIKVEREK